MNASNWFDWTTIFSVCSPAAATHSTNRERHFEALEPRQLLSITPLETFDISSSTEHKPQAKLWEQAGSWWTATPNDSGTWISRLDGESWTQVLKVSDATDVHTDVLDTGDVTHVLLLNDSASELASIEYDAATNSYIAWSVRPDAVSLGLPDGIEAATIAVDSNDRMWVAYDQSDTIEVALRRRRL